MSDYSNDFDGSQDGGNAPNTDSIYKLKLSVDVREAKNFSVTANVFVKFSVQLGGQFHQFKSEQASPIRQGTAESKLNGSFATYEFFANKQQLGQMMSSQSMDLSLIHADGQREVGTLQVPLKMLQEGEQKRTVSSMVIVSDKYLEVKSQDQVQGLVRVVLYLEDMGVASSEEVQAKSNSASKSHLSGTAPGKGTSASGAAQNPVEEQIVWQLEMWKRSEMAKFLAHLKQKEIEKIEEVTRDWKMREAEREQVFNESVQKVTQLESKVRQKATDLQRREERIIQLEEELKSKIMEVSRQLTSKEEEIMNIKKKFKEERITLESDKKRLTKEVADYQAKLSEASQRYFGLKQEVEESPLAVLRNELGTKQLEIVELESKVKAAMESREDYKVKYDQIKKDMISLKRQMDFEKEKQLEKQALELESLKTMMKTKAAQEEERRDFDVLKTQLYSLQSRLGDQATQEAEQQAKESKNKFGTSLRRAGGQGGAMMAPDRSVFFDDFARKQTSPTRKGNPNVTAGGSSQVSHLSRPTSNMGGACEWDRLMREREDLMQTGTYTADDPLIKEIDRQIQASQIRNDGGRTADTFNNRVTAP